jgi:hypothetical protein
MWISLRITWPQAIEVAGIIVIRKLVISYPVIGCRQPRSATQPGAGSTRARDQTTDRIKTEGSEGNGDISVESCPEFSENFLSFVIFCADFFNFKQKEKKPAKRAELLLRRKPGIQEGFDINLRKSVKSADKNLEAGNQEGQERGQDFVEWNYGIVNLNRLSRVNSIDKLNSPRMSRHASGSESATAQRGEWSELGSRDIDYTTRGARVRERDAIESIRP